MVAMIRDDRFRCFVCSKPIEWPFGHTKSLRGDDRGADLLELLFLMTSDRGRYPIPGMLGIGLFLAEHNLLAVCESCKSEVLKGHEASKSEVLKDHAKPRRRWYNPATWLQRARA